MTMFNYEILDLPNLAEGAWLLGQSESLGNGSAGGMYKER